MSLLTRIRRLRPSSIVTMLVFLRDRAAVSTGSGAGKAAKTSTGINCETEGADTWHSSLRQRNNVSDKLTASGAGDGGSGIAERRFTNCELLCLRLVLELETSI